MIAWTEAGAVERPAMVQVRVQRAYPGRVRAGAPVPTRSMSPDEVLDNLRYFTEGLRGPRSSPCTRLVFSGVGVAARDDTPDAIAAARGWGVEHVVLHVGSEDLGPTRPARYGGLVDLVIVPVQPSSAGGELQAGVRALRACQAAGLPVVANTVLSPTALAELPTVARALVAAQPRGAAFTFPFPIDGNASVHVPGLRAVVRGLEEVVPVLEGAGIQVDIKGLPGCYLGRLAGHVRRSANRWYVDADHQKSEAILFFPGVVSFTKTEGCRYCTLDGTCDGFFATYLRRSGFPPLHPIEAGSQG